MSRKATLGAMLSALIFVGAIFVVRWVVRTQRSPGAISVIEAQAMDMYAMKAPVGTQPVSAISVVRRTIAGSDTFPATAMAFSDEEVVARLPGRVLWTSYPGDRVKAGQIVAKIEANEYLAQAAQAHETVSQRRAMTTVARDEVDRTESAHRRSIAEISAMDSTVATAASGVQEAIAEHAAKVQDADAKESAVGDAKAQRDYLSKAAQREEELYSGGMVSLDRYQKSQAELQSAEAKVAAAQGESSAATAEVTAAAARIQGAQKSVAEARARLQSAKSHEREAASTVAKAKDEVMARRADIRAEEGAAVSADVVDSYRELRALNDAMVADRLVSPGSVVASGQKLLMLHVADPIRMQANVPQSLASSVHVGTPVTITIGSIVKRATVTSVFPQADPGTRTFTIEALLPNSDHAILPGVFGTMGVQLGQNAIGFSVPKNAVQTDASGATFVWVALHDKSPGAKVDWTCPMHTQVSEPSAGKCPICSMPLVQRSRGGSVHASRKVVETGASDATDTIVSAGIALGDLVIVAGFDGLVEGSPVHVELVTLRSGSDATSVIVSNRKGTSIGRRWTCPMHPHILEDRPGKCPLCGMDLILKKDAK